ncbi:DNA-directed RNA polymerase sigma subunit (sigma70/sigma32) [Microbacterium resistens]|uniref:DNA-directed RNA polymerase sigma subunit (Sigma70/sigma32) n=1 Tax=Microbacterium resistens TaxID=156977 RepID=A0ABU1SB17_9MICO|nr:hypothetical protein [Microbacterium resistens]MDR6866800.1 DNA-directed RNA polymerase sigma subunit (sigma70/sigma32) [Microbacterium resistens]
MMGSQGQCDVYTTLADIFDSKAEALEPLDLDVEFALIVKAQAGDERATLALMRQYAVGLRGLAKREYARAGEHVDAEETRQNVALAFMEALAACDGTVRLAAKLQVAAFKVADEFHLVGVLSMSSRARSRFFQVRREVGVGADVEAVAVELGMSRETYRAVEAALSAAPVDDHRNVAVDGGFEAVDKGAMCARAFAAVEELTESIIRDAYGFTEYEPIPDGEIAYRRGLSRSKVQRVRTGGLERMRRVLTLPAESQTAAVCLAA